MPNTKKTKIVATLGPAINNRETLKQLMISGVNVFRINFSHADYEDCKERDCTVRLEKSTQRTWFPCCYV